jgi:hypothetical protein
VEKDNYYRACTYAALGDKENMLKALTAAIKEDSARRRVESKTDPDFQDYREDPDFQKLVYKK